MKVKNKLFLSLFFLFGVIILLGGMGSYYLRWLASDSAAIMKDNNRTLSYMRTIEESVDEVNYIILTNDTVKQEISSHFDSIKSIMEKQMANITEPGEQELTEKLSRSLKKLEEICNSQDLITPHFYSTFIVPIVHQVKDLSGSIYLINEKTMIQKNEQANATAEKAVLYMGIFCSVSIIIALVFMLGLPAYISKPLETFEEAIREIARGNYKVSIPAKTKDEYGELANSFNTMAAKLEEYEHSNLAKLIKEQKRLNAVINQLDEVILGLDENKRVIFANKHCIKLLDLERHKLIGKYAPDVATNNPLLNTMIKELMIGFLEDETVSYKPLKVVEDNKEKLFAKNIVDIVEKPTGTNRNVLMGHVVILTDVTNFAEKDKAKTHFIATLSHELKTPVSVIQMSAELLRNKKSGDLTENQKELLTTIENNNERIRRMINEVLDISKIESGTIDVTLAKENVEELIEKAIEGVQLFLDEKKLSINKLIMPKLPLIKVDAHKTVWVLNNFLTNAIRYAPKGSLLEVKAIHKDHRVEISVTDQGAGITHENQKKVFQKFTRLVKTESGGTGLGLAISKEFIEAMGASIGVYSKQGEGATFWIKCLPE
ncbi:ATP-binding protein [Cytophagales bacterium LB-30]|uniref:histidine kinase n=1 Tax=Shiella aurantiaca TaxID=3058365 RepID=A0ABT8F5I1_9BACT|nr:ATP-binding protein [Shiella aurantiaca]MDN4165715.1 ATP-binding protein [Shiella aurantiaca]